MGKSSKRSQSHHNVLVDRSNSTTTGCMCSIFQLFDFPNFPFASNLHHNETQSSNFNPIISSTSKNNNSTLTTTFELPQEPSIPKGMEAPRNSLKSEEGSTSLSSIIEDEEVREISFKNIQVTMGINQIKTSSGNGGNYTPSRSSSGLSPATTAGFYSDTASSDSPAAKTPSLVARLMGLDLLPEPKNSPTTTQTLRDKAKHLMDRSDVTGSSAGSRSLPETPRISASRRSDVEVNHHHQHHHHHRLSLQIHKENVNDEFDLSRLSCLRRNHHNNNNINNKENNFSESETKSPGFYARQIVKQVKESVTRRAVSDITNREYDHNNKRKLGEQASAKQVNNTSSTVTSSSSSSCSPRLKIPSLSVSSSNKDQSFQVSKPTLVSSSKLVKQEQQEKVNKRKATGNNNNSNSNNRRKMIMQEETFVFGPKKKKKITAQNHHHQNNNKRANINIPDKTKCKKNNLLRLNTVPTLVSLKKITNDDDRSIYDHRKFQPGAEVPQAAQESKRIIMSTSQSSNSQSHNNKDCHVANSKDTSSGKTDSVALRHYITKILGCTGISTTSHVSFTNWFSPSHPLDPSIFHRLELHYCNNIYLSNSQQRLVSPKSNRKLVFDVVDELLVDILRPYINLKPWVINTNNNNIGGSKSNYYYNISGNGMQMEGKSLIETLCSRFENFPGKDCQVLEDIDALIDQDLCDHQIIKSQNEIAFEEEGEALVMEIEKDLVDTLVHETALIFLEN